MNWKKSKLELPKGQTAKEAAGVNGWRYIVAKAVTEEGKAVFAPGVIATTVIMQNQMDEDEAIIWCENYDAFHAPNKANFFALRMVELDRPYEVLRRKVSQVLVNAKCPHDAAAEDIVQLLETASEAEFAISKLEDKIQRLTEALESLGYFPDQYGDIQR